MSTNLNDIEFTLTFKYSLNLKSALSGLYLHKKNQMKNDKEID